VLIQYNRTNKMDFLYSVYYEFIISGPSSPVGVATGYVAGQSGDRTPVGARFFAHVQTGPEAPPYSCTMGTGSFPGVKRPGRGADHQTPPSTEVENE
jgi:hypothetical protein